MPTLLTLLKELTILEERLGALKRALSTLQREQISNVSQLNEQIAVLQRQIAEQGNHNTDQEPNPPASRDDSE